MMPKFLLALLFTTAASAQAVSPSLFRQLQWRFIGPFLGGGIWKTTDAGTVWTPIFDQQNIASIGALAVAQSDPNVIYVGTGEADIRSQICFCYNVSKST